MNHKVLRDRLATIQNKFKESADSIFLTFSGKNKNEVLEKSLNALYIVQNEDKDLSFFTPAIFSPPKKLIESRINFVKNNFNKEIFIDELSKSDFEIQTFNDWLKNIDNINDFKKVKLPDYFMNEFDSMIVEWNNNNYILIPIYKKNIAEKIKNILNKKKVDFFIVDIVNDSVEGLISFETKALGLLLLSMIIIFIIIFIAYKNFIHTFSAMLPSIAALVSCFAVSVLSRHDFNIMHFVSSVLLLGTGVDYGIFITKAFRDNYTDEEIKLTYQSIFISVLTTIAGFGVLAISRNYSIFSLGSSMFIGIIMAFLTAYFILPYINKRK
jgi:predicted RND superfamily exporter protein